MPWFRQSGHQIHYEDTGSGAPLLLIPGWGGSMADLGIVRDALSGEFHVVAVDPPGSGRSLPQPRRYTSSYYRDDATLLLAMIEQLGMAPAHIVGFSDGGEYALMAAALRPELVRSVATWGAAGALGNNLEITGAWQTLIDDPAPIMRGFSDYMKATYGEANARIMAQSAGQAFQAIMAAGGDISRSRAGDITCPTLLITGENDFLATPALVTDMANAIAGGEYAEAKGAGHVVHHDQPEWLVTAISSWLSRDG